ncbi:hypothetical protein FACS189472_17850 [Alphaproteobacteria bacterium]|nr:hypothetical protein FACS189472_17850 [Alphaproteobacteria bacterium]
MSLTNIPVPQAIDANRAALIGVNPKMSKRVQNPNYDPFGPREIKDEVSYGNGVRADRVAKVKQRYPNLGDGDISSILSLGAPSRNNLQKNRISQADKDALRTLAATHQVKYNPNLNSEITAKAFITKQAAAASKIKNSNQRAAAVAKWQNMITEYRDLDNKPETPDNLILRNRNDNNDIYSIDGMRLTGRTNAIVQRGVFDQFPTKDQRRDNAL